MSASAPRTGHPDSVTAAARALAPLAVAGLVAVALVLAATGAYVALLAPVVLLGAVAALLRWPDAATSIFAVLLYTNASAVAVQVHGVPFLIAAAIPLLLCLPIARDLLQGKAPIATSGLPFLMAYLAVDLVGALLAVRPEEAMDETLTFTLEGVLLYLLVTNAIRTQAVLQQVLWALIAAGACMGALVAYQQFTGSFDNNFGGFARVDIGAQGFVLNPMADEVRQPRLGGPLAMPNRFAQIMAALIPIALFQIQVSRARTVKLLAAGGLVLIMVGGSLGFSRGAAVALALVFPVMLLMGRVSVRQLAAGALALLAVALMVPQYAIRLASLGTVADIATNDGASIEDADSSTQGRITEAVAGVLMFADHPVLGVGPGMYPQHYNDYARIAGGRVRDGTREPHSFPLHIAAENGILGLGTLGAVIWLSIRDLLRARRRLAQGPPDLERLVTGVLLAVLVYLATSLFLHASYARYLWFLLALGAAAARLPFSRETAPTALRVRLVRVGADRSHEGAP